MPNPQTNLSVRRFAARLGVDEAAVRKAIRLGRLARSIVQTPRGPKIADEALAREEWVANADPGRRLAAGQSLELPSRPSSTAPLATAWNRYVDAIRVYEGRVETVYLAALEAAGIDPESIPPWPKAVRSWARVAEAELAALDALGALAEALEAAGVGLTVASPAGARTSGRRARR